ncbi:MAG: hypothetical protein ABSE86_25325 [Bryobacteraceae bacterium]|jgi:hypothetical protein
MHKITKFAGSLIPVALFVFASPLLVCAQPSPRTPRGIYAVVAPAKEIETLRQENPGSTTAQLYEDLANLYSALLGNPAVSGLTLQVHWDELNPNPPDPPANTVTYDWTVVDLAFAAADSWNMQNPSGVPKTIQLIVDPGFQSPQWVLGQIASCDALFDKNTNAPPSDCGKVTFKGYSEPTDGNVLPLPWDAVYKNAWQTFLEALAAKYGSASGLVSIAVDGPSAASAEITTASNADANNPQKQFSGGDISPNDMWLVLLGFHYPLPLYQGTDLAFIDEWDAAIDMYGTVFSGLTLVATMGEKLPDFNNATYPIPTGFGSDCDPTMSCAAETTILSYFAEPTAGGATNAKATQTSSFTASHRNLSLGIKSVKQLSLRTAQLPAPSAQILGGIQFDQSFVQYPVNQGCTMAFPPDPSELPSPSLPGCSKKDAKLKPKAVPAACVPAACFAGGSYPPTLPTTTPFGQIPQGDLIPPEQALYNLLNIYFDGTPAASSFGGTPGSTPLNYLQIFAEDIVYATNHAQAPVPVIEKGQSSPVSVTAQSMLELASQLLFQIAEPGPNN